MQGLFSGLAAALFPGLALAAGLLLAPGLAALAIERVSGRPTARSVLLLGAAVTSAPLLRLWHAGASVGDALTLLGDPRVIGTAWLVEAGGWVCARLTPSLVRYALDHAAARRTARLTAERARLADSWGLTSEIRAR